MRLTYLVKDILKSFRIWSTAVRLLTKRERLLVLGLILFVALSTVSILRGIYILRTRAVPALGGQYKEITVGTVTNLNPLFYTNELELELADSIYSSILDVGHRGVTDDLVKNWDKSSDGKSYKFALRPDIYWHNGSKLTVDDIAFTVGIIQSPLYNGPLKGLLGQAVLTILNDTEFELRLTQPVKNFEYSLDFGIISQQVFRDTPLASMGKGIDKAHIVGTGPYRVVSIQQQNKSVRKISLDAFRKYYLGQAYISRVEFELVDSESEAVKGLISTNAGALFLNKAESLKGLKVSKYTVHRIWEPKTLGAFFNTQKAPTKAKDVRIALIQALDRKQIAEGLGPDSGRMINGPISPDSLNYIKTKPPIYDIKASKVAINKLKLKGAKIKLVTDNAEANKYVAERIRMSWSDLGLNVDLVSQSSEEMQATLLKKDYTVLVLGISTGFDANPYPYWHSSQIGMKGLNLSNFSNTDLDENINKYVSSSNCRDCLVSFQEIIAKEVPAWFVFQPSSYYIVSDEIKGVDPDSLNRVNRFDKMHEWYMKTKRVAK